MSRTVIRDLRETCLPLLEPLRQPIDLDRLDPLKTAAQGDAKIHRLRRSSLEAKDPPVGDQPRREETLWWCASDSLASRRFRQPQGFGDWRGKFELGQWSDQRVCFVIGGC